MKHLHLLLFLLLTTILTAQTFGEVEIEGSIKVPAEAEPQGISIYNKNTGRGSVSSEKGNFSIYAKLNDSLYFSALQYKDLLFVVDEQTIKSRTLHVEITENINDLPEVVVRPHNLTGNLEVDADNIETVALNLPTKSAFQINDYEWEFRPDGQSSVSNAAMPSNGLQYGADPIAIIGGLIGLLLPPKKAKERAPSPRNQIGLINLERKIRSRYDNAFFEEVLNIPTTRIHDFMVYLDASGFPADLLEKDKELDLLQLLVERSGEFNEQ